MEVKKTEQLFTAQGQYDAKHILNTSPMVVPAELLDRIEKGVSIETLELLTHNKFNVYKYKTQITIHGQFPQMNGRIGGYKFLVRNKNLSVGVKWPAIDYDKKRELFKLLSATNDWKVRSNSQEFYIYKMERVTEDNYKQVGNQLRSEIEYINTDLFFGDTCVYLAQGIFGELYVVSEIRINAFYYKNRDALYESISGYTWNEGLLIKSQLDAKRKAEREARELEWQKQHDELEAERLRRAPIIEAARKEFVKNLPDGFHEVDDFQPVKGDKILLLEYGWDNETDQPKFRFVEYEVYYVRDGKYYYKDGYLKRVGKVGGKMWTNACKQPSTPTKAARPTTAQPSQNNASNGLKLIDYSEKAIAIIGDTKPMVAKLKQLGGRFNPRLSCGAGWIFSKRKEADVRRSLGI